MSAPWHDPSPRLSEARITSGARHADCTARYDGAGEGWTATVEVPRADGSTQPPAERHSAHRLPSRDAARAWCERVAAEALRSLA